MEAIMLFVITWLARILFVAGVCLIIVGIARRPVEWGWYMAGLLSLITAFCACLAAGLNVVTIW